MSQQKQDDSGYSFFSEILGSAILKSDASETGVKYMIVWFLCLMAYQPL